MKQSALKRLEDYNRILLLLIASVVAPIALTMTSGAAFSNSRSGLSAPQTSAQESKQTDVRDLRPGAPIEREFGGGETHTYRIMLSVGQYLHLVVEQKGIDVVVRLFGPDGLKIAEMDSPNGRQGPEPVSLIAETTGEYRLEVTALDEKSPPGRYEIKVEELRESTAQDRNRIAAERALAEGQQLRAQGTVESLRKAIEKYNEALPLLRAVEDRHGEALTLSTIGSIYSQLGENQKALEYLSQALPLCRAVGERREEAGILTNIGFVYWQLGESQKALEYFSQALPLVRTLGDRLVEGITLTNIGSAYDHLGKLQEALDYGNQALTLHRAVGNRRDEAYTLNNIGNTYSRLGDLQKAVENYSQALPMLRAIGERRGEAVTLNHIGRIYWELGENEKALEYYDQSLPLRRVTGDRLGEVNTLNNIGAVHQSLGQPQKALEYYNQALLLTRAVGDRFWEAAVLQSIGKVYRLLSEQQKAFDSLNQALLLQRAVGDRRGEAITLSLIGESYSSRGKPEEALNYLEHALSLHRAVGDRDSEARTLQSIARAERDRGRLNEAQTQIEAALNIIESTRSKFVSQELRTSYLASNQNYYEFHRDLLMQLYQRDHNQQHLAEALRANERRLARGLLESLVEARADIRQGISPELRERERALQQQLNTTADRQIRLLSSKHTQEQADELAKEIDALTTEYQEVLAQIRQSSPHYAALTQPVPLSLEEIQTEVVDANTLLLEYALGDERSYLWAVTSTAITGYELPKRVEIEALARRTYDLLTARNRRVKFETDGERRARIAKADAECTQVAGELSQMLLAPAMAQMKGKRLLIVSDGALQYLPFGALPEPQTAQQRAKTSAASPLIVGHDVVSLPSASTLAVLRKELAGRKPAPKAIAVLADPVFGKNDERLKTIKATAISSEPISKAAEARDTFVESTLTRSARDLGLGEELYLPRLPFTRREAEAIVRLVPENQYKKAIDFAANKATATDPELGQYRYLHFATHTLLNSTNPGLSGIVLSLVNQRGDDQEGFLIAHEIYNLKLSADLVVLSSCKTGLGKEIKGEGIIGITRGFMYAGAPRVLVSLWDVDDESTAEMMKKLYAAMLEKQKLSPAAALRSSQVSMWKSRRWRAPYFWAAFVLQGEYK